MPKIVRIGVMFIASWAVALNSTWAQEARPPQPVQISVSTAKPDVQGQQTLTVKLTIEKGWYIYANPVGAPGPIPTTVQVASEVSLRNVEIDYPPAKVKTQAGETYRIYQDQVTIRVVVRRGLTKGQIDTSPLTVAVRYQACNDQICLPPRTVKIIAMP